MKVVLIICAVVLFLGAVVKADEPSEPPITDEQAQCILDVLQNTEVDTEHVGDMAQDVRETFTRLIQHYMRCEEILSDPPTALEERRHEWVEMKKNIYGITEFNCLNNPWLAEPVAWPGTPPLSPNCGDWETPPRLWTSLMILLIRSRPVAICK